MGPDDPFPSPFPTPESASEEQRSQFDALFARVEEAFERDQVPWLRQLVDTPSHTYAREDVEVAAQQLDAMAESLGLVCEKIADPSERFADHRIYRTKAAQEGAKSLALVGHVDTVFPRSTGFLKYRREENNGDAIYGPGVLDMKSGLSVAFFGMAALKAVAPETLEKLPLCVICNSDEEVGSPSSASIFKDVAPQLAAALVFEGGRVEDKVITRRKGGGNFTLRAKGKAAHAGNNHADGRNAIVALAHVLPRIEALTQYERGVTVNVGLFSGGTAKNTVPEDASCVIDTRFETREDAEALVASLHAIAKDPFAGLEVPKPLHEVEFTLEGGVTRYPMQATPESQRLRESYEAWAAKAGLLIGEAPLQGGGSDANLLSANGVPSIDGLGPFGQYFHQTREWSRLSSLRARTQALAGFLWAYERGLAK